MNKIYSIVRLPVKIVVDASIAAVFGIFVLLAGAMLLAVDAVVFLIGFPVEIARCGTLEELRSRTRDFFRLTCNFVLNVVPRAWVEFRA